jgi:hypothetical protein
MARKYTRDNRGRFASTGATARGGRLKTASGGKRERQTMKAEKPKGSLRGGAATPAKPESRSTAPKRLNFTLNYHGTSKWSAGEIRKGGYQPSEVGSYGKGVYATTRKSVAREYAKGTSGGAVLTHRVYKKSVNTAATPKEGRKFGSKVVHYPGSDLKVTVLSKKDADRTLVRGTGTVRRRRRR